MKRVQVKTHEFTEEFEFICDYCEHSFSTKTMIQVTLFRKDLPFKSVIVCSELCQIMTELKWLGD